MKWQLIYRLVCLIAGAWAFFNAMQHLNLIADKEVTATIGWLLAAVAFFSGLNRDSKS